MYATDPNGSRRAWAGWLWPGAVSLLAHAALLAVPLILSSNWLSTRNIIRAEALDIADSNSVKAVSNPTDEKRPAREVSNEEMVERLNLPMGLPRNLRCTVAVGVTGDGRVLDAVVTRSTGNPKFDASIIEAVYKSSPFPKPLADQLEAGVYRFELRLGDE